MNRKFGISYCSRAFDDRTLSDSKIVQDQQKAIESYALRHGITMKRQYIDVGYSGLDPEKPALKRMLDDLERNDGQVNYLLVHSIEKLSRDMPRIKQLIANINLHVDSVILVQGGQVIGGNFLANI